MQLRRVGPKVGSRVPALFRPHASALRQAPHEPTAEIRDRSAALAQAHALLNEALPPSGDIDDLLSRVELARGRRIRVMAIDLSRSGVSGLWAATTDADFIVVEQTAGLARREAIVCHELAHVLLDDEADVADADVLVWAEDVARQTLGTRLAARVLGRHGYEHESERQAEILGSHIALRLAEARRAPRDSVLRHLR